MSRDQLFFMLNMVVLTIALTFVMDYFFPAKKSEKSAVEDRMPTELVKKLSTKSYQTFETPEQILYFDQDSGQLQKVELKNYTDSQNNLVQPLFFEEEHQDYQALEMGIIASSSSTEEQKTFESLTFDKVLFSKEKKSFVVRKIHETLGLIYTQRFTPNDNYTLLIDQKITNSSDQDIDFYVYSQLENTHHVLQPGTIPGMTMFHGASFHTDNTEYKKIPFSKFSKNKFQEQSDRGWFSLSQRYFATALAPQYPGKYYSKFISAEDESIAGQISELTTLSSGESETKTIKFYSGPEKQEYLQKFAPSFDKVIDLGFLWPLSKLFYYLLTFIHKFIHNWGFSIVLSILAIKLATFYHTNLSYKTTQAMKALKPELDKIKEEHKNNSDPLALHKKTTALYAAHNLRPGLNMLLTLMQIPIMIAFYWMLMESIELRQAPFIFWIQDLSVKDPLYVLPALNAVAMYLQQKLTPMPIEDPTYRAMFKFFPIFLMFITMHFPSGLVLYWLTSTIFTIIHQGLYQRASAGDLSTQ